MKVLKLITYLLITMVISFYIWNPTIENVHKYIPEDIPKHLIPASLDAIDVTFGVCVYIIYETGAVFGLSYNSTNIWLFVIIMPSLIAVLFIYCLSLNIKLRSLKAKVTP